MGSLSINFAEIESSFEPLPEGQYDVIVERVEVRESKSSDNDYLNWEFVVQDEEYEDRRLWMITSLSEKALFRLKDVFLALGVIADDEEVDIEWDDSVDITPTEGPQLLNPEVTGIACVAVVTNEMYEGRERNRVNEVIGTDAPAKKAPAKKPASKAAKSKSSTSRGRGKSSGGSRRKLR
jgi:hypothetical protein